MRKRASDARALAVETVVKGLANNWRPPAIMPGPHRHNEIELNFVEQGSMTYLFGGNRATLKEGQLAVFWAAVPHQVISIDPQAVFHWLTIPFVTFLQWRLPGVLTHPVVSGRFIMSNDLPSERQRQTDQASFRQWHEDLRQNSDEHRKIVQLESEARLRRLASIISPDSLAPGEASDPVSEGERSKVERMACFVAENYTQALKVEQIAEIVHLHPNYASNLFHRQFGIGIVDYIVQCRIAHAQSLLLTTHASISAIAFEAGFGSVSRFYTAFQTVCGQSPAAYRAIFRTCYRPEIP
jgi:AraC-like DNA-binding protein